jgi:ADP-ribosylglycohydrolase
VVARRATIAGGIAGLYYGYEVIQEEWMKELMRRDYLEEMYYLEEMCKKAGAEYPYSI